MVFVCGDCNCGHVILFVRCDDVMGVVSFFLLFFVSGFSLWTICLLLVG